MNGKVVKATAFGLVLMTYLAITVAIFDIDIPPSILDFLVGMISGVFIGYVMSFNWKPLI